MTFREAAVGWKRGAVCGACAFALAACGSGGESAPAALAIAVEVGRLGQQDLWPGFDPAMIPLAVFDGSRTVLLGHPAPPAGFKRDSVLGGWSHEGRHPDVNGASARIGDVWTATLLMTDSLSHRDLALRIVHEAFHVMQRERHPDWVPADGWFDVPMDAEWLAGRRLEARALARALESRSPEQSACWARAAIRERSDRLGGASGVAAHERRLELYEGLADYVEQRAAGKDHASVPLEDRFPTDSIRQRAEVIGAAYAFTLDRLRPDWRDQLEHRTISLDALLTEAIGTADACRFRDSERETELDHAMKELRERQSARSPVARTGVS